MMAKIKTTEAFEQERQELALDYKVYQKVENSEKLKEYLFLKEQVESKSFIQNKKEIESLQFKGSAEEKLQKNFDKLEKNRKLSIYFNVSESDDLKRFQELKDSKIEEKLQNLKSFVKGGEYKKALRAFNAQKKKDKEFKEVWEETEAAKKYSEYNALKQSNDLRFYLNFKKSRSFKTYLSIKDSSILHQYNEIKSEINSHDFATRKAYLQDTQRYEKTDNFQKLTRFNELHDDAEIVLYLKYHHTDDFKFFRDWEPSFIEEFNKPLSPEIWSYTTPVAAKGPGKNVAVPGQLHFPDGSKNFDTKAGVLILTTMLDKITGLSWDSTYGFMNREFDYTSGVVHSLNGYKQEYGFFEVKLKVSNVKGIASHISLVDESEEDCIRLVSTNGTKFTAGVVITDHNSKRSENIKLKAPRNGYIVVGLNWSPEKLQWSINGHKLAEMNEHVPHNKLGIRIETEVLKKVSKLPYRLDIDWMRCYKSRL